MTTLSKESYEIRQEPDVILFRNRVKELAVANGLSLVGQTKLITAASEIVRNMLRYAGGGTGSVEVVLNQTKNMKGIRLILADQGPGIEDVPQAMQDGFSTANSLGLGLPGAKRLANEFDIVSKPGTGTTVTIIRWKNGF